MNLKKAVMTCQWGRISSEPETRGAMESFLDGLVESTDGKLLRLTKIGTNPKDVLVEMKYLTVHSWLLVPAGIPEKDITLLIKESLSSFLEELQKIKPEESNVRIRFESCDLAEDDLVRGRDRVLAAIADGYTNEPQLVDKSGLPQEVARSLLRWMDKDKKGGIRIGGAESPYGEYYLSENGDIEGDIFEAIESKPLDAAEIRSVLSGDGRMVPDEEALTKYLDRLVLFGRLQKRVDGKYEMRKE